MTGQDDRLDSWKAIADYLNRDIRTLRRWEEQGLPIQRVPGGRGHSVFAYRSEIDRWLQSAEASRRVSQTPKPTAAPPSPPTAPVPAPTVARRPMWSGRVWAVIAIVVVAVATWRVFAPTAAEEAPFVTVTNTGVRAADSTGREQWRYEFPRDLITFAPEFSDASMVIGGVRPGVFIVSSHSVRRTDNVASSGELRLLSMAGRLVRSFAFDDRWTFGGHRTFEEPWAITDMRVSDVGDERHIAVSAHHFEWWPSVVTVLGSNWQRQGTFVNSGWVDSVRWLTPERLAISGFNQAKNGGMAALLDARAVDGASPEAEGSEYRCETCRPGQPLAYFVFPRSELNRVTGSGFNRALLNVARDRVLVRTSEVDPPTPAAVIDAIYEFSPSLEFLSASYSDRYWDRHRALELEGKLHHTRENCPERNGPPTVLAWDRDHGWQTIKTQAPRR